MNMMHVMMLGFSTDSLLTSKQHPNPFQASVMKQNSTQSSFVQPMLDVPGVLLPSQNKKTSADRIELL
jgi:hypothetical protein